MFKKDKEDNKEFKEFRTVRFYSNVNGKENSYGYNYTRDKDGQERYEEIGDPLNFDLSGDIAERIKSVEKLFNTDYFFNSAGFNGLAKMLPEMFNTGFPQLKAKQIKQSEMNNKDDLMYDFQIENNKAYLIVELPGFTKDNVQLKLRGNEIYLDANNEKKHVETTIPLDYAIDKKEGINASMNNGILEVTFKLREDEDEAEDIQIE